MISESARASAVEIRTADGVVFQLPLAGPISRLLAMLLDGAVIIAVTAGVAMAGSVVAALVGDYAVAAVILLYFGITMGYSILLEWLWNGRTLGKRALGLRVADAEGVQLTFAQVLIRNLLRAVDSLPVLYLVGGIACVLSGRMQRLGDLAAGTIVIRTRAVYLPRLPQDYGARRNSMRDYKTLAARVRQKTEPERARIALEAIRRRDALQPDARLRLFAEIAGGFKELVEFPEDATLYLTDEQYVWNVVEILFERRQNSV